MGRLRRYAALSRVRLLTDKILLGSGWPIRPPPQDTIAGLCQLNRLAKNHNQPEIPDTEIDGIINRDSRAIRYLTPFDWINLDNILAIDPLA